MGEGGINVSKKNLKRLKEVSMFVLRKDVLSFKEIYSHGFASFSVVLRLPSPFIFDFPIAPVHPNCWVNV